MSPGRRRNGASLSDHARGVPLRLEPSAAPHETLALDPAARKAALLNVINGAKRRLVLSLFRCNDRSVLDALAAALERGCDVEAIVTKRAKGPKKRLRKLWDALEEMGAVVTRYADPVVKYHAKYLVADDGPAIVTTLNPTRKCFSSTWDCVLVTHDPTVVKSLLALFRNDVSGKAWSPRRGTSTRLVVGPERSRADIRRALMSATQRIRIIDHKLSDPDLVSLLRERRDSGVEVTVLGRKALGPLVPHGKMILLDDRCAVVGSTALSTLSLDFRREVSIVIDRPELVAQLGAAFDRIAGSEAGTSRLPGDRHA
jgi:phosphatidylserine/phosphatidylglycerophosphate/cardiolipin synthase-like enzyme